MWGGSLRFTTSLLFSIGFVTMFVIGGLSGVTHAVSPADYEQTDTYYVVAHFHYVLFGGSVLGLFSGLYYWWPKFFGHMLSEKIGKAHFWLMLIGFNLTFGPMHIAGLQGMPRRIYTYNSSMGWDTVNFIETIGAVIIGISVLVFMANVIVSKRKAEPAVDDPWDGRTVEWMTKTPVPEYNFAEVPTVTHRDEFWHRKYIETPEGKPTPVIAGGERHAEGDGEHQNAHSLGIHLPSGSYMPVMAALGMPVTAYGLLFFPPLMAVGIGLLLVGFFGWVLEPQTVEEGY
jgi:cytochrome c oxidase subunit 1